MRTAAHSASGDPVVLQPVATPEDLRIALAELAPDALPTFDTERAATLEQAREQLTAAPMRRFVGQWAVYVALERHPERAARLRALEARAATTESLDEARAIAAEIGGILDAACAEAGIVRDEARRG
ncbi:DUF6247 family protein [Streptomyces himalayensis]|uniref:Uncharacterized protein n=1 Tax=Streptomyces himalayensis subsp. himalayensis TaxID=2756131 RepID=A0A7W0DFW6_9ACTN|nr:DUF6247 family protein [Streptomyces himalayensis]MBA2944322.1 hypothetical protein [Streptomyces himalayensis subsp. himalayensis]